jgi:hypothetical protein
LKLILEEIKSEGSCGCTTEVSGVPANVFKAVRRGVASDYRLTLRRLKCEARRRLMNLRKSKTAA